MTLRILTRYGTRLPAYALAATVTAFAAVAASPLSAQEGIAIPPPALDEPAGQAKTETAVLAGGCFWGVQWRVFQRVAGVTNAVSGYAGGEKDAARLRDRQFGGHRPCGIGEDHLRSVRDHLRQAVAGVFLGGA